MDKCKMDETTSTDVCYIGDKAKEDLIEVHYLKRMFLGESISDANSLNTVCLFAPEIALIKASNPENVALWNTKFFSMSMMAKGKTKGGSNVYVVVNTPNLLSENPNYLDSYIMNGLYNGSLPLSNSDIYDLEKHDGEVDEYGIQRVKFIPEEIVTKQKTSPLGLASIVDSPLAEAIFGSKEIIDQYLKAQKSLCGHEGYNLRYDSENKFEDPTAYLYCFEPIKEFYFKTSLFEKGSVISMNKKDLDSALKISLSSLVNPNIERPK
jgi:hypothetical protein